MMAEAQVWEPDCTYDYDVDRDVRWSYDRQVGEVTVRGTNRGRDAEITFRAKRAEWGRVARMLAEGDLDGVDDWHNAHIVRIMEEVARMEAATIWVTRDDGQVAKVDLPHEAEDDLWTAIDREFPTAWTLIDETAVEADDAEREWDVRFRAGEDEELALWLAEAMYPSMIRAVPQAGVVVEARRSEGVATVTWSDGPDGARRMTISLNPGDFERIAIGHDPVAEMWEDGAGRLVCYEDAEAYE